MSDQISIGPFPPLLVFGLALGMAGTGVMAFMVGALYQCSAFQTSINDLAQLLVFIPVVVTSICCLNIIRHRNQITPIILAIFSAAGVVIMLLQSGWGETLLHAPPALARKYNNYTYASDMLFLFGHSIQLISALIILRLTPILRGDYLTEVEDMRDRPL